MSQNPYLTSLPNPKANILAPDDLTHESGTSDLLRLPEVQAVIKGDFIVLPCDLICELDGTGLVDAWMVEQGGFAGATGGLDGNGSTIAYGAGGEKLGRRGGLGVWYETKGEGSKKGEETDFIATTPLPTSTVPPPADSLRRHISSLVYSIPTDTLKDITEEKKTFPIRHSLIRKHARIKMLTTYRDAHIYFFPYWVAELIKRNEKFESISEDVLGWWAKAGWQEGLGNKLGLPQIFDGESEAFSPTGSQVVEEEIDVSKFSTTYSGGMRENGTKTPTTLASRVLASASIPESAKSLVDSNVTVPSILAYVQPSSPTEPLIRRVDTAHLLLTISLRLAKLPSIEEAGKESASPFAHQHKVANKHAIPKRCRVEAENSLLAENVTIEEKTNIKECVIGYNCKIGEGARLLRCLLMENVEVGPNVQLTDCILGRRCKIEGGDAKDSDKTVLKECEVQDGQVIEWGSKYFLVVHGRERWLTRQQRSRRMRNLCASTWATMPTTQKTLPIMKRLAYLTRRRAYRCDNFLHKSCSFEKRNDTPTNQLSRAFTSIDCCNMFYYTDRVSSRTLSDCYNSFRLRYDVPRIFSTPMTRSTNPSYSIKVRITPPSSPHPRSTYVRHPPQLLGQNKGWLAMEW
jgi:translation initiation factor eIF-2B subunit gamma